MTDLHLSIGLRESLGALNFHLFCNKVEYRRRTTNKFEGRWRQGIYLGVRRQTTERIIGDPEGTWIVQSVRRVPIEDRWDAGFALGIIGILWLPNPKGNEPHELEEHVVFHPERPDLEAVAPDVAENLSAPRIIYITVADEAWLY